MAQTHEGAMKIAAAKAGVSVKEYQRRREGGQKWCMLCRDWHPVSEFGKDRTRYDGYDASCRESRNKKNRDRYEAIPEGLQKPKGPARHEKRSGDKKQARHFVNLNVKMGKLPDPDDVPCFDCGHKGTDKRHEYDHFQGYDAEHHETVQAVCITCHHKRESERQTHCVHGHPYTPANTGRTKEGHKFCYECRRIRDRGRRDAAYWRDYRFKKKAKRGN